MNKNIEMTEGLSLLIKKKNIMVVEAISVKLKSNRKWDCDLPKDAFPKPKFSYVSDEGTLMESQGKLVEEWWLNG
ncbi:MAG TPA: hypothetical protein VN026_14975 [Bacteroidia bacterium]|jgi:hypothetical protein|nr:hypothetical protein [Bacteroidia bacterium]